MNKYRISKDVDVTNSSSEMGFQALATNLEKMGMGLLAIPFVGAPIAGALLINKLATKDIVEISNLEELNTYSCVENVWHTDCIYIEHPRIPKRLIESGLYKDYILKELMAEIFNYITDNISVKKIVLGLENKGKITAGATVPISDVVVDAKLSGSLNSNYICSMEDIVCSNDSSREYFWLKYYPDIVSAVDKNAGKLEIKQNVKMELDVNLGIQGVVKGAINSEKEYSFYVYYERA